MIQLNESNYYSNAADLEYMSYSQYKGFLQCEAATMAKLSGLWQPPQSTALLVGNYVHSYCEGPKAHKKFKDKHPEIMTQKGTLRAEYQQAELMIEALHDPLIQIALDGQKEVILTGEFGGAKWKYKLDNLNVEKGFFTDLKTCKSLADKEWDKDERAWKYFIEAYGYIGQMAIYQEIARQHHGPLDPFMVIVTKETPPDKKVISFNPERLEDELNTIKVNLPHILEVKAGAVGPEPCGKCAYCREKQQLSRVYDYDELVEMYL